MTKRADILSILKEEKDFLEKQLKKVLTAINAFSDEEKPVVAKAGSKRGPKARKATATGKPVTTGKKRGRKPKNTSADEPTKTDNIANPELG